MHFNTTLESPKLSASGNINDGQGGNLLGLVLNKLKCKKVPAWIYHHLRATKEHVNSPIITNTLVVVIGARQPVLQQCGETVLLKTFYALWLFPALGD
ncbi:unnamed protein product [Leptosia nina]|uniref:Uncharacterized protein n=1 Tax=Leptosia nina TaxID=320188 RepID=A0AAV1JQE2_9NEOP